MAGERHPKVKFGQDSFTDLAVGVTAEPHYKVKHHMKGWDFKFFWRRIGVDFSNPCNDTGCPGRDFTPVASDIGREFEFVVTVENKVTPGHYDFVHRMGPVIVPPKARIQGHVSIGANEPDCISVMTYNVLHDEIVARPNNFTKCPRYILQPEYRHVMLGDVILSHEPDIICLQEADEKMLGPILRPLLERRGYELKSMKRVQGFLGVAIAFKLSKFEMNRYDLINFEAAANHHFGCESSIYHTSHSAQLLELEVRNSKMQRRLSVVNVHLKSGPEEGDEAKRYFQLLHLMKTLDKKKPLVLCGDFNLPSTSDLYKFLMSPNGEHPLPDQHDKLQKLAEGGVMRHMLSPLASAYNALHGTCRAPFLNSQREPLFSLVTKAFHRIQEPSLENWTEELTQSIDYIFHTDALECVGCLEMLTADDVFPGGLPSSTDPSDHYCFQSDFKFKEEQI